MNCYFQCIQCHAKSPPLLIGSHQSARRGHTDKASLLLSDLTQRGSTVPHLIHTLVEEGQAGVLIADKGALLYEADEQLGLGHQGVELVMRSVTALEES